MQRSKLGFSIALAVTFTAAMPAYSQDAGPLDLSTPSITDTHGEVADAAETSPTIGTEGEVAGMDEEAATDGAPLQLNDPQAELRQEIAGIVANLELSPEQDGLVRAIVEASIDSRMAALASFGGDPKRLSFRDKLKLKGEMDNINRVTEAELKKTLSPSQIKSLQADMKDLREKFIAGQA